MKKKGADYFPHERNHRNDPRVRRLRKEMHCDGYGIYQMILEVLVEQPNLRYPLSEIDLLADEFNTSEQKVRTVICNYGLFKLDEIEMFFSTYQEDAMESYIEKSDRGRTAANLRWEKERAKRLASDNQCKENADALQMHCLGNGLAMQSMQIEEKRREEKREDEINAPTPPSIKMNETLKSIDLLSADCLQDTITFIPHVMKTCKVTEFQFKMAMETFVSHLKSIQVLAKTPSDFRSHFQNWLKKQDKTEFRMNPQQPEKKRPDLRELGLKYM